MKKALLLPLLLSATLTGFGQDSVPPHTHPSSHLHEGGIKMMEPGDSLYETLHQNAPHVYNIPDVPRFAMLGKEGKFYMGIGANILTEGVYDIGNPIPSPILFATSGIPMTKTPGNGAQFKFTAQQSNIYLNVVALPGNVNQLGAYVSINFVGNNYAPSLNHAYLKYRGITAGYTYSLFTDAGASPTTIDYEGVNAFTCVTHGMIGYEKTFGKNQGWKAGIGLDMPTYSFTNASNTATVSQRVPDIPFYLQKNWAKGSGWLRFSAIIRNLYYRDLTASRNVDVVGWGIKTSGTTPIAGGLSACWQGVYGKGIASYIQDLTGLGMDLMPDPDNSSALDPVEVWGAYGGLQYNFNPKWFCSTAYGHVRTYDHPFSDSSSDWKTGYKYAQYAVANIFCNVNSIVQVGLEYLYGRRVDYSGTQSHDNRIEAMLKVSF
ncbi:MAG: porin [Muribaculaceae bacterium]|nr:porin [Muribaculaceae bacterium]